MTSLSVIKKMVGELSCEKTPDVKQSVKRYLYTIPHIQYIKCIGEGNFLVTIFA